MRVEDFTFEQRPLGELPTTGDLISWLADFGGDDQWVLGENEEAAVVLGDHIIIWRDEPLTEQGKKDAVAEYERTERYRQEEEDFYSLIEDDLERLQALGFTRSDFEDDGSFATDKLPRLLALCEHHPEYHIVTQCVGGYCNRVCKGDPDCYYLSGGDNDPELFGDACEGCKHYECS
jgi:hypothetical protein